MTSGVGRMAATLETLMIEPPSPSAIREPIRAVAPAKASPTSRRSPRLPRVTTATLPSNLNLSRTSVIALPFFDWGPACSRRRFRQSSGLSWAPPICSAPKPLLGALTRTLCGQLHPKPNGSGLRVEQDLDGAGALALGQGQDGLLPLRQREAVGDHVGEVEAGRDEVEVVLDGMLADAVDLFDAEGVGTDNPQLLEIDGRPLEAAGRLDAAHNQGAAGVQQSQRRLDRADAADRVVHDRRA